MKKINKTPRITKNKTTILACKQDFPKKIIHKYTTHKKLNKPLPTLTLLRLNHAKNANKTEYTCKTIQKNYFLKTYSKFSLNLSILSKHTLTASESGFNNTFNSLQKHVYPIQQIVLLNSSYCVLQKSSPEQTINTLNPSSTYPQKYEGQKPKPITVTLTSPVHQTSIKLPENTNNAILSPNIMHQQKYENLTSHFSHPTINPQLPHTRTKSQKKTDNITIPTTPCPQKNQHPTYKMMGYPQIKKSYHSEFSHIKPQNMPLKNTKKKSISTESSVLNAEKTPLSESNNLDLEKSVLLPIFKKRKDLSYTIFKKQRTNNHLQIERDNILVNKLPTAQSKKVQQVLKSEMAYNKTFQINDTTLQHTSTRQNDVATPFKNSMRVMDKNSSDLVFRKPIIYAENSASWRMEENSPVQKGMIVYPKKVQVNNDANELDIIADKVYRLIEMKILVEKERRGLR